MKTLVKNGTMLFIGAALCLGCGSELFNSAEKGVNGYRLAAVAVGDGTSAKMIVIDGDDYFREMGEIATGGITPPVFVVFNERGAIFVAQMSTVSTYTGNGGWSVSGSSIDSDVIGLAVSDDTALVLTINDVVYEFRNNETPPWKLVADLNTGLPESGYPIGLAYIPEKGIFILASNAASEIILVDYRDQAKVYKRISGISFATFFTIVDDIFYAGNDAELRASDGNAYPLSPFSASAYTIINNREIYAVGGDATETRLLKLDADTKMFVVMDTISTSGGAAVMERLDENRLLIGVSGAGTAGDNGLYKYTVSTKTLQKIYSLPVYGIAVRR